MAGQLMLITGAVRSGKSRFAEQLARHLAGASAVTYVATAQVWDEEMAARVAAHQSARSSAWTTLEEPLQLAAVIREAISAKPAVVLVESVDMWVSNRLMEAHPVGQDDTSQLDGNGLADLEAALLTEVGEIAAAPHAGGSSVVAVTVEAGWGVVPPYPLGRAFRDLLGRVNSALAAEAERAYLMVAGLPVDVKRLSAESAEMAWAHR
jgi:adenosylcobinamide kinase/adenosylcobinamide-phosphate guanylyltransferase